MKKTANRIIPFAIAFIMLFAMTTVAFAATQSGPFTTNEGIKGTYTANLNIGLDKTTASLNVIVKQGPTPAGTAVIRGSVTGIKSGREYLICDIYDVGDTACSYSATYSGYTSVYGICNYIFYTSALCTLEG